MPVSKKKTTVIKNVNKNKNNINITIHAKKKTVAKKRSKSSPHIPNIISPVFNVSVPIPSQYASMPSYTVFMQTKKDHLFANPLRSLLKLLLMQML